MTIAVSERMSDNISATPNVLEHGPMSRDNLNRGHLRAFGVATEMLNGGGLSMSPRQSTGKRLRFEIFKRDRFTCQYCGAQPPAVVLVLDHRIPVVEGGLSDEINLVTACEPCNQGKAGKPLNSTIAAPDADLLYLEAQQEAAELRRYQAALQDKEAALMGVVADLQDLWCEVSDLDWSPKDRIIRDLLLKYSPESVEAAIRDVAPKVQSGYIAGRYSGAGQAWVRYLYAVARNTDEARD